MGDKLDVNIRLHRLSTILGAICRVLYLSNRNLRQTQAHVLLMVSFFTSMPTLTACASPLSLVANDANP